MTNRQTNDDPSIKAQSDAVYNDRRQILQWAVEQAQVSYKEIKDKHDDIMDTAKRLLGYCALSSFVPLLSKSTWANITHLEQRIFLLVAIAILVIVVLLLVSLTVVDIRKPISTPWLPGSDKPAEAHFANEEIEYHLRNWNRLTAEFVMKNKAERGLVSAAYFGYAVSVELYIFGLIPIP